MTDHSSECLVLLVEDDVALSEALADTLRDEGYVVACAGDGLEALDYLRAGARPDVILLDLMMPRMNGEAFRAEQQNDPTIADIPIVVISAGGDSKEKSFELGAAGYLPKPVNIDALVQTVERHC
jgi:two-component system response regulator MprA